MKTHTEQRVAELERRVFNLEERLQLAFATLAQRRVEPEWRADRAVEAIISAVCAAYDLSRDQLISASRIQRIIEPRHVAIFLARTLTEVSLAEIGMVFGGRDHGTVLHATRSISGLMETEPGLRARVAALREGLKRELPEIVRVA